MVWLIVCDGAGKDWLVMVKAEVAKGRCRRLICGND